MALFSHCPALHSRSQLDPEGMRSDASSAEQSRAGTDKTAVTGDLKLQAWPILMTLANISRKRRGKPGGHVFMGRMPDVITNRSTSGYISDNVSKMRVFHECMKLITASLKEAARR